MRTVSLIIVHYSANKAGSALRAEDIDRYHRSLGWKCCGYHYVIPTDGTIEAGRPPKMIIGHNTDEWQAAFCQTMRENNIGYTFWPYKKMDGSSFVGITPPENWANIVYFSEAPRATYKEIREARPAQAMSRKAMMDFIEACKLKNCVVQEGYIRSLGMK